MAAELKPHSHLEIGHVLFMDVVGYSKLLGNEQREVVQQLNQIVRNTDEFRAAEAEGKLVRLPVGDGMALVFFNSPEAPVQCALEISQALPSYPQIRLRMGVNSGPIDAVTDVNDRSNVSGAGINMAQRVMDCGDAGHILLSKRVAEDLAQYGKWQSHLYDLGEFEVKHGVKVALVNLYTDGVGNRELPEKLKQTRREQARATARRRRIFGGAALLLAAVVILGWWIVRDQTRKRALAAASLPYKSIAVLPFDNLSDDKQNAYFADGVQDEILTHLAKVADLKVISRTSVMQYKSGVARNLREIAQQLGVAHLLEGSVQRAGGKVRVNAQLIDARNDAHLWAQTYDRELADVFAIQSEIAKTIADELKAKISPTEKAAIEKPPTTDLAAYDLYLRARALYLDSTDQSRAKENLPECVRLLDQVLSRDPNFVSAWCLLSNAHGTSYYLGLDHTPERLQKANAAVQAALRIDPNSGEAHLANALYYYRGFRDFKRAREELTRARQTLPNNAQVPFYSGVFDYRQGDWPSATSNIERAVELDPRNLLYVQQMALCYQPQRRYADELRMWDRALSIVPGDGVSRIGRAGVAANARGDMKPYQETMSALLAENPDANRELDDPFYALRERTPAAATRVLTNYSRDGVVYYGISCPHTYWEGVVARWQGDSAKARSAFTAARTETEKILQEQPDFAAALSLLGMLDAGLGRKEDAIREGRRACELLPMSKDAVDGVAFVVNLAQIYAWTGEKDLAIEQLNAALKVPNDLHYGELRLHPLWDVLRGHAGFEKIVASQAPK
jgi:TolB-like protein/class 3 adenylate cyclase/Flp pilus assembly protein TadD